MKQWKTTSGYEIIQVLSGRSNVFLLLNGEKNILIDTSVSRAWPKLLKRLNKLAIHRIDYLILTHAHFDHAANAGRIQETFNARVVIQGKEERYLSNGDNMLPRGTTLFTRPLVHLLGRRLLPGLKYPPCKPDLLIDTHYDLRALGFTASLIHTPGHTAGSMSLIVDDEIAIVGDTMFGVFKWSVFPPYAEDIALMIHSWGKLLETKCSVFLPSHGTGKSRSLVQKDFKKRIKKLELTTKDDATLQ